MMIFLSTYFQFALLFFEDKKLKTERIEN